MANWYDLLPKEVFGEEPKPNEGLGMPIGMGNTGPGDPSMPKHMVQTTQGPKMLHPNEGTMQNPDGSVTVVPQQKLADIQQKTGMGGFADGGTLVPKNPTNASGMGSPDATTPSQNLATADPTLAQPSTTSLTGTTGGIGASTSTPSTNTLTGTTATPTAQQDIDTGIGVETQAAKGNAPITQNMENTLLSQAGGQAAASMGAAKQGAAQSGATPQAIGAVEQQQAATTAGNLSRTEGQIAATAQQTQQTAAQQLITSGEAQQQQDVAAWQQTLATADATTPAGLAALQAAYVKAYGGTAPDMGQLVTQQQNVKDTAAVALASAKLALGDTQYNDAVNQIKNGATFDQIQAKYGGVISQDEFNTLKTQGDLTLATTEQALATTATTTINGLIQQFQTQNPSLTSPSSAGYATDLDTFLHGAASANLRKNAALAMGGNPSNSDIDAYLTKMVNTTITPASTTEVQTFINENQAVINSSGFANDPDLNNQLALMVQNGTIKGGELTSGSTLPWNDPSQYLNFYNVDGTKKTWDANGNPVPEQSTQTYTAKDANGNAVVDKNGNPVSYSANDISTQFSKLSSAEQAVAYNPQSGIFTKDASGQGVVFNPQKFANYIAAVNANVSNSQGMSMVGGFGSVGASTGDQVASAMAGGPSVDGVTALGGFKSATDGKTGVPAINGVAQFQYYDSTGGLHQSSAADAMSPGGALYGLYMNLVNKGTIQAGDGAGFATAVNKLTAANGGLFLDSNNNAISGKDITKADTVGSPGGEVDASNLSNGQVFSSVGGQVLAGSNGGAPVTLPDQKYAVIKVADTGSLSGTFFIGEDGKIYGQYSHVDVAASKINLGNWLANTKSGGSGWVKYTKQITGTSSQSPAEALMALGASINAVNSALNSLGESSSDVSAPKGLMFQLSPPQ